MDIIADLGAIFIGKIITTLEDTYLNIKRNKYVENSIDNFLKFSQIFYGQYSKELEEVFSSKSLKEIKGLFENESKYDLRNILIKFIEKKCKEEGIPQKDSEEIADFFFKVFLIELQNELPEVYDKVRLGKSITVISENIDSINKKIDIILGIKYKTISEIEENLQGMLIKGEKNKEMSILDFFDYEDKNFCESLKRILKNSGVKDETVYIEGPSREEAFYNILNVVKKEHLEKDVLIIESLEEWEKISKEKNIKNKILIANFYEHEIKTIPENMTIFIFGEEEKCQRKKIIIKKRLIRNLKEKLEKLGYSHLKINDILDKTRGVYSGIKREIFNSRFNSPKWTEYLKEKQTYEVLKTAILLGEWLNTDKSGIEEKFKINYDNFIIDLKKVTNTDEPLIIQNKDYYFLICPEEAVSYLKDYLRDEDYKDFFNIAIEIISEIESEDILYFESEYPVYNAIKYKYSRKVKNGILRTLILLHLDDTKNYYAEIGVRTIINNVINNKLDDELKWDYLSNYIQLLCEISPKAVLEKLEEEVENNDIKKGILKLFSKGEYNSFFKTNSYIKFLWTIEYLLQVKNLSRRALHLLFKINDLDIKYRGNSPAMTLRQVFCVWKRDFKMSKDDILKVAEHFIKNYKYGWEVIKNEIPKENDTMFGDLAKPKYLNYSNNKKTIAEEDCDYLAKGYIKMCIDCVEEKGNILELISVSLIKKIYYYNIFETFKEKLKKIIKFSDDEFKKNIQDSLRKIIYENRFFERGLKNEEIEEIYLSIKYVNPVHGYRYLFHGIMYNSLLINPIKYKDENYFEKNKKKKIELVEKNFRDFKDKQYSYIELLNLGVKDSFLLGKYIFKIFSQGEFKIQELIELLKVSGKNEAYLGYSSEVFNKEGSDGLKKILKEVRGLNLDDEIKVKLLFLENLDLRQNPNPLIESYPNLKEKYWRKNNCRNIKNKETAKYIEENTIKYQTQYLIEDLFFLKDYLSPEELFNYLVKIQGKCMVYDKVMDEYYLEEIFKKIYDKFLEESPSEEDYHKIAEIEIYFRNVLSVNKLKGFLYLMEKNPSYYCKILKLLYKEKIDGEIIERNSNKNILGIESLYFMKFCPCIRDNEEIDFGELKKWCEDFKNNLKLQNQEYLYAKQLGKVFAYSPKGSDGFYPHESIRKVIEKMSGSILKELQNSYEIELYNERGVYGTNNEGEEEERLSEYYKINAEAINLTSPKTASIYFTLSYSYKKESQEKRDRAVLYLR